MAEQAAVCFYCGGRRWQYWTCVGCGAPERLLVPAPDMEPEWERGCPFYYNGLMVWPEWNSEYRCFHFWQGNVYLTEIKLTVDWVRAQVPQGTSLMPYVWKLFEVSQGDRLGLLEMDTSLEHGRRALFLTIRRNDPERERYENMTWEQLLETFEVVHG